ncbi:MAG: class IIb bacteriocin, lactobin A/cerein 7B family [Robiginitomaculum sp.]
MRTLTTSEIKAVNGGLWPLVIVAFAAGYKYGKDRAERDNKKDENKQSQSTSTG